MGSGTEMKLIAHRGNINGPNKDLENSPNYVESAVINGYDVEVDIWVVDNIPMLGHDKPQYKISKEFIIDLENSLWFHCKNDEAVEYSFKNNLHFFYHDIDRYTLTSWGYIWGYPGSKPVGHNKFIVVLPEVTQDQIRNDVYGICSDYVKGFKNV